MKLRFEGIGHEFGSTACLAGIDLTVGEREVVALLGPSGCGKSTLLGIAGGLLVPAHGRVMLEGTPPAGSLNPVTYVFQDAALLPWRTVAENISFAFEHVVGDPAERGRLVDEALQRVGLTDFAKAYPKQLSGGMRQRVGIARALAVNPALLLMDEPLSALDAQSRELLIEDFLRLWASEPVSVLYVTHNIDEALRLADRIVVLSRRPGRIRDIVEVPIPQAQRTQPGTAEDISALHDRIWSLIRDEAAEAERQLLTTGAPR